MVSESTVCRLVDYNVFSARNIDLPRKIRYSRRRVKKHVKVDKKCKAGRTYQDFQHYMAGCPGLPVVEIGSVEGTKGGKVLLADNGSEFSNPPAIEYSPARETSGHVYSTVTRQLPARKGPRSETMSLSEILFRKESLLISIHKGISTV